MSVLTFLLWIFTFLMLKPSREWETPVILLAPSLFIHENSRQKSFPYLNAYYKKQSTA